MPNHRVIVAAGFQIFGLVTALPSSMMAITMGIAACMAAQSDVQDKSDYLSVTHYGLVGLLANAGIGANQILLLLNSLAAALLGLLAALAPIAALFGGLLYIVGRGMRISAKWARYIAVAITVFVLLNGLVTLWVMQGAAYAVSVFLSLYALWVLTARYTH